MLILGSKSARRKELLESASIDFELISSDFDETHIAFDGDVTSYVEEVAKQKAQNLLEKYPNRVILTADTMVELDGKLLGKPTDEAHAKAMLEQLSGKTHNVCTGVCILKDNQIEVFSECAKVTFNKLSSLDIETYIITGEPMDKAGAYAIQGEGAKLIKEYHGDFHTIMGLPLKSLLEKLKIFGIYPNIK